MTRVNLEDRLKGTLGRFHRLINTVRSVIISAGILGYWVSAECSKGDEEWAI
jgi:hypothetical protein